MDSVKLIECPRDAWQGLRGFIPTERKVEYLRSLIAAGFRHLDAVSFVSPKAVPQMTGVIFWWIVASRRADFSSAISSVSPARYFSSNSSCDSAIDSTIFSR